jgi:hypothetical protein
VGPDQNANLPRRVSKDFQVLALTEIGSAYESRNRVNWQSLAHEIHVSRTDFIVVGFGGSLPIRFELMIEVVSFLSG